jgi:16S rRNA (cytosine967-C5)-methyltransferase
VVSVFAEALGEDGASGYPETEQALAADSLPPAVTLCVAPGHSDPERLPPARAVPARWSPFGRYLETGDPASLPAVRAGDAAVQDEANQLAVLALTRASLGQPDRRWLDLCAGPGGKARLLAWLAAAQGARLAAMDIRPHRAQLVAAATARTGAAATVVADGTVPPWRTEAFDRVIADAPCSGLGALRRRPEARWRKTPADVTAVGALQRRLLASALDAARPGGVVAYVTCSPHVQETRAVVEDTMASRGGVTVLDTPAVLSEVPDLACPDPGHAAKYAQFWPHRHGTDAIFVALLRRDR